MRTALMNHLPRVGLASGKLPNGARLQMYCDEPESILNALFYRDWKAQEPEVLPLWFELARAARVIIDVGAHVGNFTLIAGLANRDAKIFSFEPLPRIHALLTRNVKLNKLGNVEIRARALGRKPAKLPFYTTSSGVPSSSSFSKDFMLSCSDKVVEISLEVSTLDLENLPRGQATIMKIDTETTEPDVIAGGGKFIAECQPIIIVEILDQNDSGVPLEKELSLIGYEYEAYLLTDRGPILKDAIVGDSQWRNFLLVPKDRSKLGPLATIIERQFN